MENKNMNVLKWSVGVLAILNIVLLVNTWKRPGHLPPVKHMENRPAERITKELKFSEEQTQQFEKLKEAHQAAMKELDGKGRELRNQYFDLLKQESADQTKIDEYVNAIADNQRSVETTTFNHFKALRNLCNEEQKAIFTKIIDDVLKHMARRNRGEGPPPPPGNGPPPNDHMQ